MLLSAYEGLASGRSPFQNLYRLLAKDALTLHNEMHFLNEETTILGVKQLT